jgi:hypothetical protein
MKVHARKYKLVNEAAFKAAAACPLDLSGTTAELKFDREEFLQFALSFAEPEGNGQNSLVPRLFGPTRFSREVSTPTIGGASDLFRAQYMGRFCTSCGAHPGREPS